MALKIKTPPAEEPVTLTEAKDFIREGGTNNDALITSLIVAMRDRCEKYIQRPLVTQTWTLTADRFPAREKKNAPQEGYYELPVDHFDESVPVLEIPRPPLQSVTFIKTYDLVDVATTFDSTRYLVDTNSEPGRIALNSGQSWPTGLRKINGIEIEFVAGYGLAAAVPEMLKMGILNWIKILMVFKSQSMESDGNAPGLTELMGKPIPPVVVAMWDPYRILNFK